MQKFVNCDPPLICSWTKEKPEFLKSLFETLQLGNTWAARFQVFSSFSGSSGNTDTRTRNTISLTVPCRDSFVQHSQDHTSTSSHQKNNLTQYLIITLRLFSLQSHHFQRQSSHLRNITYIPFLPKIFSLPFSISQVCYLDDHTLPRKTNPCLCLICQVILPHSSRTPQDSFAGDSFLILFLSLPHFPEGFFTYKT